MLTPPVKVLRPFAIRFPVTVTEPAPETTPLIVVFADPATIMPEVRDTLPLITRFPAAAFSVAPPAARLTPKVWVEVELLTRLPPRVMPLPVIANGPDPTSKAMPTTDRPERLFWLLAWTEPEKSRESPETGTAVQFPDVFHCASAPKPCQVLVAPATDSAPPPQAIKAMRLTVFHVLCLLIGSLNSLPVLGAHHFPLKSCP